MFVRSQKKINVINFLLIRVNVVFPNQKRQQKLLSFITTVMANTHAYVTYHCTSTNLSFTTQVKAKTCASFHSTSRGK
jgi:hypothetical protein